MERENRSSSTTQNLAAIMYTLLRSSKSWNVTYNSFDKLGPGPYIKDIHAARKNSRFFSWHGREFRERGSCAQDKTIEF
jgi:hypothetical protein